MQRVTKYLRLTASGQCLSGLTMLHMHCQINVDLTEILNQFTDKKQMQNGVNLRL